MLALALAAVLTATPVDWQTVIAQVQPGDTVAWSGAFGNVAIQSRAWSPPVTFDRTAASFGWFYLYSVQGVEIRGGQLRASDWHGCDYVMTSRAVHISGAACRGDGVAGGVMLRSSSDVAYEFGSISDVKTGVMVLSSDGYRVNGNRIQRVGGDGIDLGSATNGETSYNVLTDPITTDATHPDAIQMLNPINAGGKLVTGLKAHWNVIAGPWQGITAFVGGKDLDIQYNTVLTSYPQGIALTDVQGALTVANNRVATQVGAPSLTTINLLRPPVGAVACGNVVEPYRTWSRPADPAC